MTSGNAPSGTDDDFARHLDVTLRLLPVNATLASLCIVALVFLETAAARNVSVGFADDVLAVDAMLYGLCIYLILWSGRTSSRTFARRLFNVVDVVFLLALTTMLLAAGYVVFMVF